MQGGDSDLAWAAAVQDGTVVTRGPWKGDRRAERRPRGSLAASAGAAPKAVLSAVLAGASFQGTAGPGVRAAGALMDAGQARARAGLGGAAPARRGGTSPGTRGASAPRPDPRRRRHQQQDVQQQQRQQPQRQQPAADDALAAYSRPGPRSTARVAHCRACDVWVPRRAGDWEVHVGGIRHRRQLLSLRVHGERNRLVLSAFEAPPGLCCTAADAASGTVQRLVGRAAADFGLAAAAQPRQPAAPPELAAAARRLRTEALKQLLNMFGVGQVYSSAAAVFEEERLVAALQRAADAVGGGGGASRRLACGCGAELAAAAHAAQLGHMADAAELAVEVVQPAADAPRSQHAALAAALPPLLAALQRSPSLARLTVSLPRASGGDAARLQQLWQSAWQHTQPALRGLLGSSAPLRHLHLVLPPCLREAAEGGAPQLAAAAADAPVAVRRQLLLALHPRAGRCSLLQLLPLGVLRLVLDLAAPLQPCSVTLAWAA